MTREAALAQARQVTRNYAKRQSTWFRNQFR
jgi:tRNA dimethylallyltransferase